jgi:Cu(I)/Ag(I) efflux system membrane fusion protein
VTASLTAASVPVSLQGTAKAVFTNYLTVQAALANDSLDKVGASAESLAKAIRTDGGKAFPTEIAEQAERLARARDLGSARKAFQPLSESLVRQVKAGKVPSGTFVEVYCPMAKSSWLQTDKVVRNPYFGRASWLWQRQT